VRDRELKQHFLMGSDRSLSEALSGTVMTLPAKAAGGTQTAGKAEQEAETKLVELQAV
jgi:hypothetical protein